MKIQILLALVGSLLLSNCGHFVTRGKTYQNSSGVGINGAKVFSSVKPNGGKGGASFSALVYIGGVGVVDGPFLWRIQAEGEEGVHESMVVHRAKVLTSTTKREEWFPKEWLGKAVKFESYKKEPGKSYASFQFPGELEVYPEKDGDITVLAEISVRANGKREKKIAKFELAPGKANDVDFLFLPAEIFKPKDPREWKW